MAMTDVWVYRQSIWTQSDLTGFAVEALDGKIGKADETSNEVGAGYIVADAGPWIFGKKVLLPAGVIQDVDLDTETILVNRTKDEIKNAPEFDANRSHDETYRSTIGRYYGGAGYRDADF